MTSRALPPEALRACCDAERLPFATTDELAPVDGLVGQERASEATAFGIGMTAPGYHLFVVGPPATGKASTMRAALVRAAAGQATPPEHCYVADFDAPRSPRVLTLPAGRGHLLRDAMARAIGELATRLSHILEGDELVRRRRTQADELERREQENVRKLEEAARREGFVVERGDVGIQLLPASPSGKALERAEVDQLAAEERARIEARGRALDERVAPLVREMRDLGRDAERLEQQLVEEAARTAARELLADVRRSFADLPAVIAWLDAVERDLVAHAPLILAQLESEEGGADEPDEDLGLGIVAAADEAEAVLARYRVNLLVDRAGESGAPVVVEERPSHGNLLGRVDHRIEHGALTTDFTHLQAGALHRANGGYLLVDARDLLSEPFAWQTLKRALKTRSLRIEEPLDELRLPTAETLTPEPIPLAVKVVLLGTPEVYAALYALDDELRELFKVKVEFADSIERTPATELLLARVVAGAARAEHLPPLSAGGAARLVEESARWVEHQARLSTRFGELLDLVREAAYFARTRGAARIDAEDVRRAVTERAARRRLVEDELARQVDEGVAVIATDGDEVAQVNGLEVLETAGHEFGRPMRVTARVRPGRPGVVDVERRAGLGGALHTKGVLILSGYLGGRYAGDRPLAMAASIVAEQSYGPIDGDSASCAEACALLSALAEAPLAQSLAVTGAIDQRGAVQAVGGINQKIEGFFDACQRRGLTGAQGVILPAANARHLMLREDVVAAARAGRFHLHVVATVDEAMALLTGREIGERDADGRFPAGSLNEAVEARLQSFARSYAQRRAPVVVPLDERPRSPAGGRHSIKS